MPYQDYKRALEKCNSVLGPADKKRIEIPNYIPVISERIEKRLEEPKVDTRIIVIEDGDVEFQEKQPTFEQQYKLFHEIVELEVADFEVFKEPLEKRKIDSKSLVGLSVGSILENRNRM
jgi:hypothetical protein